MGAAVIAFAQAFVYGAAAGASAAAIAGAALGAIAQIALINAGLGFLSKKLAGKPERPTMDVTYSGPTVPRRVLYGRRRCFGSIVYSTLSTSGGTRNDYLWLVVALVDHQCSAINTVWIDGEKVEPSQINGSGLVISGKFAQKLSIWKYLGTSQQTANAQLTAANAEWTVNHRLQGVTYLVLRCQTDDEAWAQGAPQNVSALVDGMLCYDPRLDSTNGGSGSQRAGDPSTWTFTRNPFLHARHYLTGGSVVNDTSVPMRMFGLKDPDSRMMDSDIIAAANVCDELLTGGVAPPGTDNTRYHCDIEFEATRNRRDVLEAMMESCAGGAYPDKGKWRFFAGAYETPIHTLTQDDLYGELKIRDTSGHEERFNAVSGKLDQCDDMDYVEHTTIFQTNATFEADDGDERIPMTIDLEAVTNQYQAQRLAYLKQLKGRLWRKLEWTGSRALLKIRRGENVLVSHSRYGWVNHVYRCIERQFVFEPDRVLVVLTLEREDSAAYTDLTTAAYTTGVNPTPVFMIDGPATPFSFVAESTTGGIKFSWAITPGQEPFQTIYELWEYTSATPFSSATKVWEGAGFNYFHPRNDLATKYYWIRARAMGNQISGTNPETSGLAARASTKWEAGNALNLAAWRIGALTGTPLEVGNFSELFSAAANNEIVLGGTSTYPVGPRNATVPLWMVKATDPGLSSVGGWQNNGDCGGIDPLKTYRSILWFRYSGTASGNIYHSPTYLSLKQLNGADAPVDAYFMARPLSDFIADRWYCSVSYIHGSGYGTTASGQSGVFDSVDGRSRYDVNEFKNAPEAANQSHDAILRACANSGTRVYFAEPRFEEVNGNEPSLLEIIGAVRTGQIGVGATEFLMSTDVSTININSASLGTGVNLATFDVRDDQFFNMANKYFADYEFVVTATGLLEVDAGTTFVAYLDINITGSTSISNADENLLIETASTGLTKAGQRFNHAKRVSGLPGAGYIYVNANAWNGGGAFTAKMRGVRVVLEAKKRAAT